MHNLTQVGGWRGADIAKGSVHCLPRTTGPEYRNEIPNFFVVDLTATDGTARPGAAEREGGIFPFLWTINEASA